MPRDAARIFLKITGMRVERLQDITLEDMGAEGFECSSDFFALWDSLNADRGFGWDVNPWVWVVEFEKIDADGTSKIEREAD